MLLENAIGDGLLRGVCPAHVPACLCLDGCGGVCIVRDQLCAVYEIGACL